MKAKMPKSHESHYVVLPRRDRQYEKKRKLRIRGLEETIMNL